MKIFFCILTALTLLSSNKLLAQATTWTGDVGSITWGGSVTVSPWPPSFQLYQNIPGLMSDSKIDGQTFFIGDTPANASDYYALAAPATTIIGCPNAERFTSFTTYCSNEGPLTGATLFVEDQGDASSTNPNYYRLAYIVGEGASGQTIHLKPDEVILIALDSSMTIGSPVWLAEDPFMPLKTFEGPMLFSFFTTSEYYYQAVAKGTTTLNFALVDNALAINSFNNAAMFKQAVTFTIQVDDGNDDAVMAR